MSYPNSYVLSQQIYLAQSFYLKHVEIVWKCMTSFSDQGTKLAVVVTNF